MKRYVLLPFFAATLLLFGCNNRSDELEKQNSELQAQHNQMQQELASRDEYVETVTSAIDDIYNNLAGVQSKEKHVLNEANALESGKKMTRQEMRQNLLNEISTIDSSLKGNQKKVDALQTRVTSFKKEYTGLRRMVANLKQTISEREQAIAQLEEKVRGLEADLDNHKRMLAQRDSVITDQNSTIAEKTKEINTGYYVIGTRRELEDKGIIQKDGGFLWGLLGSTTILSNGFSKDYFKPISKLEQSSIEVNGPIDEILPKRNEHYFSETKFTNSQSVLKITEPSYFWQDNYLVIITD